MPESQQSGGTEPEYVGLSLSGGGFRATLFHLGVVRLLYETGLLGRIKFISGVSGGAILAAHLGLNWKRYTSGEFDKAADEIIRFVQKDVRNRVLRRWILAWLTLFPRLVLKWSRVELLRREYRGLLGDWKLSELPIVYEKQAPRIIIQSASMTTGLPCSFGRSGLMLYKVEADGRGINLPRDVELGFFAQLTVAHAVAASSAFPPMFPPLKVDNSVLGCDKQTFPDVHYLTDAGVFDNLGMDRPLTWFDSDIPPKTQAVDKIKTFIISDAEGRFNPVVKKSWLFKLTLPRNVRATDILMRRVSTLTWAFLTTLTGRGFNFIRIPGPPQGSDTVAEVNVAHAMRTDLDGFSDLEIEELVNSGFKAAQCELTSLNWISSGTAEAEWCPVPRSPLTAERRKKLLTKSSDRRWMPLLFAPRDWSWWALSAMFLGLLYLGLLRR